MAVKSFDDCGRKTEKKLKDGKTCIKTPKKRMMDNK